MNKKLLAAAIGTALVAGPMLVAQADVKLVGRADVSIDVVDRSVSGDDGEKFLQSNSSYIGINASEDLGGGLKAIFGFQSAVRLDQSTAIATDRNNFVGLEGGWGTLRLGQYDTPVKQISRKVDRFHLQLGESRALTRQQVGAADTGLRGFDERFTNSLRYDTPKFGDFRATIQYGLEDSFTSDANNLGAGVTWEAGPLWVGLGYETHDRSTLTGIEEENATRLGVEYKLGDLVLSGLYQAVTDAGGVSGADRDTYGIGAAFKVGNNVLKAQWYTADEADNATDDGADLVAVGIDHMFSKTTTIYAQYAAVNNDDNGSFALGGGGHGASYASPGEDISGFSLGMRLLF